LTSIDLPCRALHPNRCAAAVTGDDETSTCICREPNSEPIASQAAKALGAFLPHARAKKLPRAAECLVYSLTPSGVLAENHPKNRGFVGILRGQKCLKRRFLRRSPAGEWSRGARSMPRVFGRGSRSQPAALVSDRDDAALFPAIRILERYGSAKSGRARVRMGREEEPGLLT
jgi:hypothetical protein